LYFILQSKEGLLERTYKNSNVFNEYTDEQNNKNNIIIMSIEINEKLSQKLQTEVM